MKKILLFALLCVGTGVTVCGQTLQTWSRGRGTEAVSVLHAASGRGVVSPGCAAVVAGGLFAAESFQPLQWPLPTSLGGVAVEIGGIEAAIYYADQGQIKIIVPDVPRKIGLPWREVWESSFSIRGAIVSLWSVGELSEVQKPLVRWYPVRVTSLFGVYQGWVAIAPTAPGFYLQSDWAGEGMVPLGTYVSNAQPPRLLTSEPIANADTVLLLIGSGFLRAGVVQVFISDEKDGYWVVQAATGRLGLLDWQEQVNFRLPPDAHGVLTMTAQADAMTSNQIQVTVR